MRRTATHLFAAHPDPVVSSFGLDSGSTASDNGGTRAPGSRPDPGAISRVGPVR